MSIPTPNSGTTSSRNSTFRVILLVFGRDKELTKPFRSRKSTNPGRIARGRTSPTSSQCLKSNDLLREENHLLEQNNEVLKELWDLPEWKEQALDKKVLGLEGKVVSPVSLRGKDVRWTLNK